MGSYETDSYLVFSEGCLYGVTVTDSDYQGTVISARRLDCFPAELAMAKAASDLPMRIWLPSYRWESFLTSEGVLRRLVAAEDVLSLARALFSFGVLSAPSVEAYSALVTAGVRSLQFEPYMKLLHHRRARLTFLTRAFGADGRSCVVVKLDGASYALALLCPEYALLDDSESGRVIDLRLATQAVISRDRVDFPEIGLGGSVDIFREARPHRPPVLVC